MVDLSWLVICIYYFDQMITKTGTTVLDLQKSSKIQAEGQNVEKPREKRHCGTDGGANCMTLFQGSLLGYGHLISTVYSPPTRPPLFLETKRSVPFWGSFLDQGTAFPFPSFLAALRSCSISGFGVPTVAVLLQSNTQPSASIFSTAKDL